MVLRPRQNEDTLWRQHCVLRRCPSVAKRGNIVARYADTNVPEDLQKHLLCPGHKICVRCKCCARGKTSQHLRNMITSAMLPPQCVLVACIAEFQYGAFTNLLYWVEIRVVEISEKPQDARSEYLSQQKDERSEVEHIHHSDQPMQEHTGACKKIGGLNHAIKTMMPLPTGPAVLGLGCCGVPATPIFFINSSSTFYKY